MDTWDKIETYGNLTFCFSGVIVSSKREIIMSLALRTVSVVLTAALLLCFGLFFATEKSAAQKRQAQISLDPVTSAIRSGNSSLVRISVKNDEDRFRARQSGLIISDYDSFVVVSTDSPEKLNVSGLDFQRIKTSIDLPGAKFDPILAPPSKTVAPTARFVPEAGYYIVQFGGIVRDEWLDDLRNAGIEIIQYVPHHAFFVYGEGSAILAAAKHSRIRWVGEYLPRQKLSPHVWEFAALRKHDPQTAAFDVAVFGRSDLAAVASEIETRFGGTVLNTTPLSQNFFNVVRVEFSKGRLEQVAALPAVFRIDPYVPSAAEDERAAQIVAGNYLSTTSIAAPGYNPLSQFGVTGLGVTVAVVDDGVSIPGNGGFYVTSSNAVDGPLRGATSGAAGGHGHINASIVAGNTPFGALDPFGYNYGLGIAPSANIINLPFLKTGNSSTDAEATNDAVSTLGPNGMPGTISNNSWGAGINSNTYDSYAAMYDGFVRDASSAASIDPIVLVFSAGNSGPGALTLTRPKAAKNLIAVGNSENLRTEFGGTSADNIDDLRISSSRGPTADGRIKPDVIAPGSFVTGSRAGNCSSVNSCFDVNHAWSTGTSHAAPQVAGAAALFTQYWRDTNFGQNPSPALIKAAIINSAVEMNGISTNTSIPNGNEGWGRIDMSNMFNTSVPIRYVNEADTLSSPGQNTVVSGSVVDATKPLRVTLVWTDPPAAGDPALVNDLDLTVTVGANTYFGNIFAGGVSTTGGTHNSNDNVENVFLPAGTANGTPVTVTISAAALNGDGVLGNADSTDQNFALVIYNGTLEPTAAPAEIAGRITDAFGCGVPRTSVNLLGSDGSVNLVAITNTFGFYRFPPVPTGANYVLTPANKRYSFSPESILIQHLDALNLVDFVASVR
jgi:hypothetical protein